MAKTHLSKILLAASTALPLLASAPYARAQAAGPNPTDRVNRGLVSIVTGPVDSTAARVAADLSDVVDDGATRRLLAIVGKGSLQNLTDLRMLRGIDLAILQADVLASLRERRAQPNLENAFTYVAKLYREELHVLAGEPIRSVADLAGKKVNVGVAGSGTAITLGNVLARLNIAVEQTTFDHATAMQKLSSGEIAAVAVVTGKPAPMFLTRAVPAGAHFLSIPMQGDLGALYQPARIQATDYPSLVASQQTVDTIAVDTILAAANFPPDSERYRNIAGLVDAFFTNFDKLQEPSRHPKWQEVDIRAEMAGWRRFGPADAWLKRNPVESQAVAEGQLKDVFMKFLEERSRVAGGVALTQQRKDELFDQYRRWQRQRPQ
jgi:TRAP-type uncharacterized transport system substrate-binding protein